MNSMQNKFQCDISLKTDDTKLKKINSTEINYSITPGCFKIRSLYDITLNVDQLSSFLTYTSLFLVTV